MNKDKFKKGMSAVGTGLLTAVTVVADSGTRGRIYQIDEELEELKEKMETLQEERQNLADTLSNPLD